MGWEPPSAVPYAFAMDADTDRDLDGQAEPGADPRAAPSGGSSQPAGVLLSIVINTFDRPDLLARALESVTSQARPDVEVLVADDGSASPVRDLVEGRFPGVAYLCQPNAGLSAARNLGARHARGRFVMFLDDDDELMPGAVSALVALLDADDVGIASGAVEWVAADGTVTRSEPRPLGPAMGDLVASFIAGSFAIRAELLEGVGGFDEELRCSHQTELFLRAGPECVRRGWRGVATAAPIVGVHRSHQQDRDRNDPERLYLCTLRILERHRRALEASPGALADLLATAGVAAVRAGHGRHGRRLLMDSARTDPKPKNLARAVGGLVPPLARLVWGRR